MLTNAFPSVRASHAIGLAYGIAGLGNAAGPLIGGLLTETVGWRWIFWLNVPLTLVVPAIGARSITESFDETVPRRIDVAGLALVTVGIGLFTLTFDPAPSWGWLSAPTVIAFTTVATQAVVRTERAGEAAGVTLTALVGLAGVGVAVSGTVLEMLQRAGMSPAGAVDAIVAVLAALLLPAGVVVLLIARASNSGTGT